MAADGKEKDASDWLNGCRLWPVALVVFAVLLVRLARRGRR